MSHAPKLRSQGPRLLLAAVCIACLILSARAALADTIEWQGITWEHEPGTSVIVDSNGDLLIESMTYEYTSAVWVDLASTPFNYVEITVITPSASYGPGLLAEYRDLSGIDYSYVEVPFNNINQWIFGAKIDGVTTQTSLSRGGSDTGQTYTLGIGRRSDGIIDFYLNQILVYSTPESNKLDDSFNYLFLIGGDIGSPVTYSDLTVSTNYNGPEDGSEVPEPGTMLLFASGLGLAWCRRFVKKPAR